MAIFAVGAFGNSAQAQVVWLNETLSGYTTENGSLNTTTSQTPSLLSIYDAYLFYCKFYSNPSKKTHILVSKSYFDKYMIDNYNEHILENGVSY
jgi:hypothetical protein